ncbi:MAG: GNAT family N-acetyltransferase [Actinobacteria bacterium]|nr:GNAT family N-acetyltransferase [Actinomycetota bacterium]
MPWEGPPAPARIETERLVIRCYEPADAPLLKEAIDSSIEHLRPFSPWLETEPVPVEERAARMEQFRSAFDAGDDFVYGIFDHDGGLLGGTGLHPRVGPGGLEIGYFVRASATRQGIATEAAAALTRVGFEVCDADRMEIRIDPQNHRSLGIPEKLGYSVEAMLRRRLPSRPGEPLRDVVIHTLFREDYDPEIAPALRVYDALGRQLV